MNHLQWLLDWRRNPAAFAFRVALLTRQVTRLLVRLITGLLVGLLASLPEAHAKSYQDYLFELSKKSTSLHALPRSNFPQIPPGKSGALFYCHPYCEWISFFGNHDQTLYWQLGATPSDLRVVFSDEPEFKFLFPNAPSEIQNPLIHEASGPFPNLKPSFSNFDDPKRAKDLQISFQGVLGLLAGSTSLTSDSNMNVDAESNTYFRYLLGFSLNLDRPMTFFDDPWLQHFEVQMEKSMDRVSKNGSGNSSTLSGLRGNYFLMNSSSKNQWGAFLGYSQSNRQYKSRSIQAIATQFQEIWIGGRYHFYDWKIELGTNILTKAQDADAFRTSPQDFKRFRLDLEKCFSNSQLFGGQIKYCAQALYAMSQEKTNLSEQISPISVTRQFTESNYGLGLKIYYGGAPHE